ncbi:MAG TPA: hypothetical protein PKC43_12725 [Phycisphaerales bacterium]|nr:hypothetical protein [Phycisphaerales bacterium]HMP38297.1 hypothetical protein [Phycisphaerales bacterium]
MSSPCRSRPALRGAQSPAAPRPCPDLRRIAALSVAPILIAVGATLLRVEPTHADAAFARGIAPPSAQSVGDQTKRDQIDGVHVDGGRWGRASAGAAARSGGEGGVAGVQICTGPEITQSFDPDTLTVGTGITCVTPDGTAATSWARSFPMADPVAVECVRFGVELNQGGPFQVSVTLLVGDVTGPPQNLIPLATTTVDIPGGSSQEFFIASFPGGIPVVVGSDLVVAIEAPSRRTSEGGDGGGFFPGMNVLGQSAPTYIQAATCGVGSYTTMAAVGFANNALALTLSLAPPPPPACPYPPQCCDLVCSLDPFCCAVVWDSACDSLAQELCFATLPCDPPALAQLFLLRSGQSGGVPGAPGQADDSVRCHAPGGTGCFSASLGGSGLPFALAAGGPPAEVVTPVGAWTPTLPSDPAARWINWNAAPGSSFVGAPPQSTLYAHPFTVTGSAVTGGTITLRWAADDRLGDPAGGPAPVGAYVNGHPLPLLSGGNFAGETIVTSAIPASALAIGTNYLYLYQRDIGCAVSGVIYSADIVVCALPPITETCVKPPPGMRGWWPFDETAGTVAHDLTPFSHFGFHQPLAGGPTPVPGIVAGALAFDGLNDSVVVPPAAALDVSCGAFSVDLWVKRNPPGPNADFQTLVSHYVSNGGWIFGIDTANGTLGVVLEGSALRCVHNSIGTVAVGTWTHVALTVGACCGSGVRQVQFYINGVATGSAASACCDLTSLGGPASIAMGNAVWISDWFSGVMDEVEYFCRVLSPSEVAALHAAGPAGKCKQSCHASWDRQLCANFGLSTNVDATIVNHSTVARTFTWSIAPSGACPLAGVTYAPSSGAVFVPPGGSATIVSSASIPSVVNLGQGCFDVTFTDVGSGTTCTASGSFIAEICGFIVLPGPAIVEVGPDQSATGTFRIIAGPQGADVPFSIVAMPSDMISTDTPVSINGLPPGDPVIDSVTLQPNQMAEIVISIAFPVCGAIFDFNDVILFASPTPGALPIGLASFGVRMAASTPCPGDLNDDGVVDGADLGILLGDWGGSGPGDLNGDGVVDGADLGALLGYWGPCP